MNRELLLACSRLLADAQHGFVIDCPESLNWERQRKKVLTRIDLALSEPGITPADNILFESEHDVCTKLAGVYDDLKKAGINGETLEKLEQVITALSLAKEVSRSNT